MPRIIPPYHHANGIQVGNIGACFPQWPSHHSGQWGICAVETSNETVTSPGAPWVELANSPQGTGTGADVASTRLTLYGTRATSNAMPTIQIADSGDHQIAQILVFGNVSLDADPYDDLPTGNVEAAATSAVTCVGGTTTQNNSLVVQFVAHPRDIFSAAQMSFTTNPNLSDFQEITDIADSVGNGGGIAACSGVKVVAGAYSGTTGTLGLAGVQARITLSLKGLVAEEPQWARPVGAGTMGGHPPRVRGDLWVEPGSASNPTSPYLDTTNE